MERADADNEVLAFPMISVRPVEREFDLPSLGKRFGREIRNVNPQPGIVCLQVLPAVRRTDVADRSLCPRSGTSQRQGTIVPLGKQQWRSLKFPYPGGIAAATVSKVWREQDVRVIIGQCALLRDKLDLLQNRVAPGIGHNLLFDAVAAILAGIEQPECRHTVGQPFHFVSGIAFSSEKKSAPSVTINPMSRVQAWSMRG